MFKKALGSSVIVFLIVFGTICSSYTAETYNLNGDWDAVITKIGAESSTRVLEENDVIKISQKGTQFVGTRTIGGKLIGKNEEMIKGKLSYKMVDEVFIRYVSDPTTFDLSWIDGRATIIEEGSKIIIQSYIESTGYYETVTLTRKP